MGEMDEIVKEFLVESNEGLDQLDRDLVALEKCPDNNDLLCSIFRAIHTVKGTSGVLGYPKIEAVAHAGENLLSRLRDGQMRLNPEITTALLAMVDALREMLGSIASRGEEGTREIQGVVAALSALLEGEHHPAAHSKKPKRPSRRRKGQESAAEPPSPAVAEEGGEAKNAAVSGNNLRVDVGLLDRMMTLVGELVLARNQILQHTSHQRDAGFTSAAQRLNLITTELQESVMKTRMQPIGNIWNKLPRLVRDLALACGKRVRVEMDGADTDLDKTIIEAIKDPLTHIVRNAVDHGIELPDVRNAAGKPDEGRLLLRAYHEGGQVNIEISDDGRGIDVAAVREKARDRGLVPAEQIARMNERELLNLIFLPGLSTAKSVTNISGRGVGMDVVKTNIEKIGGTVDLMSVEGASTTLKIKIPLTLAIIPALVATSAGERFAIPQVSLLELVRLEAGTKNIEYIHGAPVYRLRGSLLPLVYLDRELGLRTENAERATERAESTNIVVLQADGHQFGVVVDEINDTEEIVVKPLSNFLKGLMCFAGATIMGDGEVALILDVMGLAQQAGVVTELREHAAADVHALTDRTRSRADAWLLTRVGSEGRVGIPLSSVDRLEEFATSAVEHSSGNEVVQYRGEIMPLVRLAKLLNLPGSPLQEVLPAVVASREGRSVGLVVDQIEDVTEHIASCVNRTDAEYLSGSAVLQHQVTDLLDVDAVIRAIHTAAEEVAHA